MMFMFLLTTSFKVDFIIKRDLSAFSSARVSAVSVLSTTQFTSFDSQVIRTNFYLSHKKISAPCDAPLLRFQNAALMKQ